MRMGRDEDMKRVVLKNGDMSVALLNYGAITQGWWLGDTPLILGYETPEEYLTDPYYVGAIVGRVANRISGAQFELGGTQYNLSANEGGNTLHGGTAGLSHQRWALEQISPTEAAFDLVSPDGDNGFPGQVRFEISVQLKNPCLTYSITAQPDRPTPISISQHNYYALGRHQTVSEHGLKLASDRFLEVDDQGIPSGVLQGVKDGGVDFTRSKPVGRAATDLDHYFVFDPDRDHRDPVANVHAPSGLGMTVYSDQPGAQVYSAAHLSAPFRSGAGLCIEPSGYVNAPNIRAFPSIIYSKDHTYRQTLTLEISDNR